MHRCLLYLFILAGAVSPAITAGSAYGGDITTYAGPGLPVSGAQAVSQAIDPPMGVAADGSGGFYVVSVYQNRVYRIGADGKLSVVAGLGTAGFSGDGGPATAARLYLPMHIALDGAGNLYISDTGNQRIRKVNPSGVISTVAGDGTAGFGGDAGPATAAKLRNPHGLAVDASGNLFIADYDNSRVRKVIPAGVISTVAGTGALRGGGDGGPATEAALVHPIGVAVDRSGSLLIADYSGSQIRKVTSAGIISTVAGTGMIGFYGDGGQATAAYIYCPSSVTTDPSGNMFIADSANHCIRKVTPAGVISTVAGTGNLRGRTGDNGPAIAALLNGPTGVAVDEAGNLLISDYGNFRVRKVTPDGIIRAAAGNGTLGYAGDGGPAAAAFFNNPSAVAADSSGNLFVADTANHRIRKITPGGITSTIAGTGVAGFSGDGGGATAALLNNPSGVAVDISGNLFVADSANERIRKITPGGVISTVAGVGSTGSWVEGGLATSTRIFNAVGVAVDGTGNLFIAVSTGNWVTKVTAADGRIRTLAGGNGAGFGGDGGRATAARLLAPMGVAVDLSGNVFIADNGNSRIRKVAPDGNITTVAGGSGSGYSGDGGPATAAKLFAPYGVAVDGSGSLLIADAANHTVRKINSGGIISTLAGNGMAGFSGDGGPGTAAQLYFPTAVALDGSGSLFIADSYNHRIRKLSLDATTYFAHVAVGNGYSTVFTFGNSGAMPLTGVVSLADQQGNPLVVKGALEAGTGFQSSTGASFPITIPTGGITILTVSARDGDPLRSGWARVNSTGGNLYGVGTFQAVSSGSLQGLAGVLSSAPISTGIIPIDDDTAAGRFAGYAVANTGTGSISIEVREVGADGRVANTLSDIHLGPGQQKAAFFFQDPKAGQVFKGSAVLTGRNGATFTVVALVMNQNLLTAIPVLSSADSASGNTLFGHLAIGGGYSTVFTLMNTGAESLTGTLRLSGQDGNVLNAAITDGQTRVIGSSYSVTIPSGGTRHVTLAPANGIDPTKAGWASVSSTGGKLGGVATFQLTGSNGVLQTIAGVLSSTLVSSATIPVNDDAGAYQFTGYAVANAGNSGISIAINEVSADGTTVTPLSDVQLGPGQQKAVFFVQDPKAGQKFKGSAVLTGRNGATFCAVGLVQIQGLFTAIPVVEGKSPNIN
jgi:sugar lactone lactonase YvrE